MLPSRSYRSGSETSTIRAVVLGNLSRPPRSRPAGDAASRRNDGDTKHGPCRVIHVLGSGSRNPRIAAGRIRERIAGLKNVDYFFVALGSVATASGRRWLTHEEISEGALKCERTHRDVVVGDIDAAWR